MTPRTSTSGFSAASSRAVRARPRSEASTKQRGAPEGISDPDSSRFNELSTASIIGPAGSKPSHSSSTPNRAASISGDTSRTTIASQGVRSTRSMAHDITPASPAPPSRITPSRQGSAPSACPGVATAGTTNTGREAWRTTYSATLPMNTRATPVRPWVPTTMASAWWAAASSTSSVAGSPKFSSVVTATPLRARSSRAAASSWLSAASFNDIVQSINAPDGSYPPP